MLFQKLLKFNLAHFIWSIESSIVLDQSCFIIVFLKFSHIPLIIIIRWDLSFELRDASFFAKFVLLIIPSEVFEIIFISIIYAHTCSSTLSLKFLLICDTSNQLRCLLLDQFQLLLWHLRSNFILITILNKINNLILRIVFGILNNAFNHRIWNLNFFFIQILWIQEVRIQFIWIAWSIENILFHNIIPINILLSFSIIFWKTHSIDIDFPFKYVLLEFFWRHYSIRFSNLVNNFQTKSPLNHILRQSWTTISHVFQFDKFLMIFLELFSLLFWVMKLIIKILNHRPRIHFSQLL